MERRGTLRDCATWWSERASERMEREGEGEKERESEREFVCVRESARASDRERKCPWTLGGWPEDS